MKNSVCSAPRERRAYFGSWRWVSTSIALAAAFLVFPADARAQDCYYDCGDGYCCPAGYPWCCSDGTCSTTSDCGSDPVDECYTDCGNGYCCDYDYPYCCPGGTCSTSPGCGDEPVDECYTDCGNGYCCDYEYPYCCGDGTCSTQPNCGGQVDECYSDCGNGFCCGSEYPYCCADGTCATSSSSCGQDADTSCYWDCGDGTCCPYDYSYCCADGTCSANGNCGESTSPSGSSCPGAYPFLCSDGYCYEQPCSSGTRAGGTNGPARGGGNLSDDDEPTWPAEGADCAVSAPSSSGHPLLALFGLGALFALSRRARRQR